MPKTIYQNLEIYLGNYPRRRMSSCRKIKQYHQYCNVQRKIYDEDNSLFKINQDYVKLKELKLKQQQSNQFTEILETNIQELQTQQLIHDEFRDQLDEEFRKIVEIKKYLPFYPNLTKNNFSFMNNSYILYFYLSPTLLNH
ncbi:hypothetical protein pb186bvf_011341 [Paramecium bursaria]